jgi:prepilin-type N-terminal cleavage/methylation domain-containing protein
VYPRNLLIELWLYWGSTLPLLCKPTPLVQQKALQWLGWLPKRCHSKTAVGFTLAELLIALAILGVIATFTIPKIINSQQNGSYNAIAKEVAAMLAGSYQQYVSNNTLSASVGINDLTQYMNYISTDTISSIDDVPGYGSKSCAAPNKCLKLHSGAMIQYQTTETYAGTSVNNAVNILLDPDGIYSGTTNGSGKAVRLFLNYNGKVTSWIGTTTGGAISSVGDYGGPFPSREPSWLSW